MIYGISTGLPYLHCWCTEDTVLFQAMDISYKHIMERWWIVKSMGQLDIVQYSDQPTESQGFPHKSHDWPIKIMQDTQ